MGSLFIVTLQPFGTDLSHLIQRLEHIRIEHFGPIGPVIPLNQGILIRLALLDVPQLNPSLRTPADEPVGDEFGTVVGTDMARHAAQDEEVRQDVDDIGRLQPPVDPDRQAPSWVNSSMTFSMRNFLPLWVRSSTKS